MERIPLTIAQRKFLQSYLGEFDAEAFRGTLVAFRAMATKLSFDGPASKIEIRVAKHLHAKGLLSECNPHGLQNSDHLEAKFSETGAQALWWVSANQLRAS